MTVDEGFRLCLVTVERRHRNVLGYVLGRLMSSEEGLRLCLVMVMLSKEGFRLCLVTVNVIIGRI